MGDSLDRDDNVDMELQLKENLRRLLANKGYRAAELCRRTGLAPSVVSEWLSGRVPANISNLKKVADELGVSLDDLCFRNGAVEEFAGRSLDAPKPAAPRIPAFDPHRIFPFSLMMNDGSALYEIQIRKVALIPKKEPGNGEPADAATPGFAME